MDTEDKKPQSTDVNEQVDALLSTQKTAVPHKHHRAALYVAFAILLLVIGVAAGLLLAGDTSEEAETANQSSQNAAETTEAQETTVVTVDSIEALVRSGGQVWGSSLESLIREFDEGNDNVSYTFNDNTISIMSNGLPDHETGEFPNPNNPNTISEQDFDYSIPRSPVYTGSKTDVRISGITLGGIPMEPGTAETDQATGWNIEAFNSGVFLAGTDASNAHVQPNGTYHYHGLPTGIVTTSGNQHSNLLGFAADGFPIYGNFGHSDPANASSDVENLRSSWQLRGGQRGDGEPAGTYNGDYTQDFVFSAGSGDLDECNGRFTVTPEFPDGTYAYFITEEFPFIGRCVMGEVSDSFNTANQPPGQQGAGGQGGQPPSGPPPGGQAPPQ